MTSLKTSQTHCTLCSLGCALGFERTPLGRTTPLYPGHITDLRHGICGRGHINYDLLEHPLRMEHPLVRKGDGFTPIPLAHMIDSLVGDLAGEPTLVLVNGSLLAEDIVAAANFARLLGKDTVCSVYMDPADAGMLTGVAASEANILTPERLAECDAVLSIGDAFGTHPVISRTVHAITKRNPRRLFAVVDSVPSRTTKLGNAFLQVRPGATSFALRSLAGEPISAAEAASKSGLAAPEIAAIEARLKASRKLGVLVTSDSGRDRDPEAIGFLAGRIAQKYSGGVLPLPILGNAWAALGIGKALGTMSIGQALSNVIAGRYKNVLLLGVDPSVETPLAGLSAALARVPTLIVATYLSPTPDALGTHFLPLATAAETTGTLVNGSGEVMEIPAVLKGSGGAMTPRDILAAFAARLGQPATLSTTVIPDMLKPIAGSAEQCLATEASVPEPSAGELLAVSEPGCVHVGAGAMSSRMSWPNVFEERPVVRVCPDDAAALNLKHNQAVVVRSAHGSAPMKLALDIAMKPGRAALMTTKPAVRALFNWTTSTDGRIMCGPVAVSLSAS